MTSMNPMTDCRMAHGTRDGRQNKDPSKLWVVWKTTYYEDLKGLFSEKM